MTFRRTRHRLNVLGVGARMAAVSVLAACHPGPRPTPAPSFAGASIDTIPLSAIETYANGLTFDTTAPASDTITVVDSANVRAHALIAPEIGTISLTPTQLAQGRIIALIRSDATSPSLGLTTGLAYMWVDSGAAGWRVVTIPDKNLTRQVRRLILRQHPPPEPSIAEVRWETFPLRSDTAVHLPKILYSTVLCGRPHSLKCCGTVRIAAPIDSTQLDSAVFGAHKSMY